MLLMHRTPHTLSRHNSRSKGREKGWRQKGIESKVAVSEVGMLHLEQNTPVGAAHPYDSSYFI
jgi:hypothetical protein